MTAKELEKLSEKIHKLYCEQYLKDNGEPYWTHGDYSKLNEKTKEYDRNIARFINKRTNSKFFKIIREIEKRIKWYNDMSSTISEVGASDRELQTYTDRIIGLQEAKAYFNKYLTTKK